jgi:hypothetical protein
MPTIAATPDSLQDFQIVNSQLIRQTDFDAKVRYNTPFTPAGLARDNPEVSARSPGAVGATGTAECDLVETGLS